MSQPDRDAALTMPQLLERCRSLYGDDDAVVTDSERITYAELDDRSRSRAASLVALGLGRGSRIAMLLPNGPDWVITFTAITRIGAIAIPSSTFYQAPELATSLAHADTEALFLIDTMGRHDLLGRLELAIPGLAAQETPSLVLDQFPCLRTVVLFGDRTRSWAHPADSLTPGWDEEVQRLAALVEPSDPLTVIYTSGSTSEPKGVVHGHGAALRHAAQLAKYSQLPTSARVWTPLPLFWVGGMSWGWLRGMTVGAALVTQEVFEPNQASILIRRERVSAGEGWLPVMRRVTEAAALQGKPLTGVTGGDLRTALNAQDGIEPPAVALGMTETFGPHTYRLPTDDALDAPHRAQTGGRALPGVEHRILDRDTGVQLPDGEEGVIAIRGYNLMLGMFGRSGGEVTDTEGWFVTGDLGCLDGEWLSFTGRANDMIKTRGSNVAPSEVEAVLREYPGVQNAYVVGITSPETGEDVVAMIVPDGAGRSLDTRSISRFVGERVSNYKVPRRFVFVDEDQVPWLPSMKLDRRGLRVLAAKLDGGSVEV